MSNMQFQLLNEFIKAIIETKIQNYGVPNTIFSDMNEILMASAIMGGTSIDDVEMTVGPEAAKLLNSRIKQVSQAILKAKGTKKDIQSRINIEVQNGIASANEVLSWAASKGYGEPSDVTWTARPGALDAALKSAKIKEPATPGHPADIAIVFNDKVLGVSAKATKGTGDIGFKNPGWGTYARLLNIDIDHNKLINNELEKIDHTLVTMPKNARKLAIRRKKTTKIDVDISGQRVLKQLRDALLVSLSSLNEEKLRNFVLTHLVDAQADMNPPYIKVTATSGGKNAHVHDPTDNPMMIIINSRGLKVEAARNDSIVFSSSAGRILQLRLKFESQALASSIKMSAEPVSKT